MEEKKEVLIKVKYDDTCGYKGHGNDVALLIKEIIEREIDISLVDDKVISSDYTVEIIS